jgi:hypothetical protein
VANPPTPSSGASAPSPPPLPPIAPRLPAPSGAPAPQQLLPPPPGADLAVVKDSLSKGGAAHFLDLSLGRVTAADVLTIQGKVDALHMQTGAKVWVVAVPAKVDVEAYRPVYNDLGMKGKDLLVVFNGERRHLHCQSITKKAGNEILRKTKDEYYKSNVAGLSSMLDECATQLGGTATTLQSAAPSGSAGKGQTPKATFGTEIVLAIVAVGILLWVIWRRRQRDAELEKLLKEALAPAEAAVADTLAAVEASDRTPEVKRVIDRADGLQRDIDDVKRMPLGPQAITRARSLRAEARKLRRDLESLDK